MLFDDDKGIVITFICTIADVIVYCMHVYLESDNDTINWDLYNYVTEKHGKLPHKEEHREQKSSDTPNQQKSSDTEIVRCIQGFMLDHN